MESFWETRNLWSTLNLWYDTPKEEVERIVSRSGEELDLHVVVNQNDKIGGPDVCSFLNGLAHTTSRWRTFTVTGDWIDDDDSIPMDVLFDKLIYAYRGLTLQDWRKYASANVIMTTFSTNSFLQHEALNIFLRDNPPWVTPSLHTLPVHGLYTLYTIPIHLDVPLRVIAYLNPRRIARSIRKAGCILTQRRTSRRSTSD